MMLFVFATVIFSRLAHFSCAPRQFGLRLGFSLGLIIVLASAAAASGTDVVLLKAVPPPNSLRQVRAVIEVEGQLTLNADGKEIQHLPLKAQAELQYTERLLARGENLATSRAVRSYAEATATIKLRESELKQQLREDRRLIATDTTKQKAALFSPLGPLTREELELVEAPASGIVLEALLPGREVKLEESWRLADDLLARLLNLDAVSQQDVRCTLQAIEEDLAIVALQGTVAGAVSGVSSDIELKGKLNFDLRKQMVTWLTLAYREKRAIGHAQPGFEVVTKLRLVSVPASLPAELNDASLAGLPLRGDGGQMLLDLRSEAGGFHLAHDRRWRVMLERHDATVLRFVDRGDLIGQCNLSPRPPLAEGHQLTREGFEADVKSALGKNAGQIVAASEGVTAGGLRVLRVVVSGAVGELPIQWTYYHLSDDHGRRAALVFTMEAKLVEQYPQIDGELVAGFQFLADQEPRPAAAAPTAGTPPGTVR